MSRNTFSPQVTSSGQEPLNLLLPIQKEEQKWPWVAIYTQSAAEDVHVVMPQRPQKAYMGVVVERIPEQSVSALVLIGVQVSPVYTYVYIYDIHTYIYVYKYDTHTYICI